MKVELTLGGHLIPTCFPPTILYQLLNLSYTTCQHPMVLCNSPGQKRKMRPAIERQL